jgi:hypothetical protein
MEDFEEILLSTDLVNGAESSLTRTGGGRTIADVALVLFDDETLTVDVVELPQPKISPNARRLCLGFVLSWVLW